MFHQAEHYFEGYLVSRQRYSKTSRDQSGSSRMDVNWVLHVSPLLLLWLLLRHQHAF